MKKIGRGVRSLLPVVRRVEGVNMKNIIKCVRPVCLIYFVIIITFSLSACVYGRFGNPSIADQSKVGQVKVGKTKEEVKQILGTPTGTTQSATGDNEIWVYTHHYTQDNFIWATKYTFHLSVVFDKDGIVKSVSKGAQ